MEKTKRLPRKFEVAVIERKEDGMRYIVKRENGSWIGTDSNGKRWALLDGILRNYDYFTVISVISVSA